MALAALLAKRMIRPARLRPPRSMTGHAVTTATAKRDMRLVARTHRRLTAQCDHEDQAEKESQTREEKHEAPRQCVDTLQKPAIV